MNWRAAFTVIDFETTGVDDSARAVEIGLVRFENEVEVESCNYVLKPLETDGALAPLHEEALKVNGLMPTEIAAALTFAEVWPGICGMFHNAVPLAYNASFDRRFLQRELRHAWPELTRAWEERRFSEELLQVTERVTQFGVDWIDPWYFVAFSDRYQSKKLVDACLRRGIKIDHAHRAVDDARATGKLWLKFAEQLNLDGTHDQVAKRQISLRINGALGYHKFMARKRGEDTLPGDLYVCDACFSTSLSKSAGQLPDGWGMFSGLDAGLRAQHYGSETIVVCSPGCHEQFGWWSATLP